VGSWLPAIPTKPALLRTSLPGPREAESSYRLQTEKSAYWDNLPGLTIWTAACLTSTVLSVPLCVVLGRATCYGETDECRWWVCCHLSRMQAEEDGNHREVRLRPPGLPTLPPSSPIHMCSCTGRPTLLVSGFYLIRQGCSD
jgi:hypothetical protein